jgi:hypothetical protein
VRRVSRAPNTRHIFYESLWEVNLPYRTCSHRSRLINLSGDLLESPKKNVLSFSTFVLSSSKSEILKCYNARLFTTCMNRVDDVTLDCDDAPENVDSKVIIEGAKDEGQ